MRNKNFVIEISETSQKELYKKAVENMRIKQYQEQDDMRVELSHREKYIGSLTENRPNYLRTLGQKFLFYKKNKDIEYLC